MPHNAAEARALLFNRKLQEKPVEFSLPGLEELDGELSVLELKASELKQCEKLAEGPDEKTDEILMMAAVVCKSLVMRATKERLFSDTDMGTTTGEGSGVAAFGLVVLKPLSDLASEASGIGVDLLAETKKKLQAAQSKGSQNSSTANSGQPAQDLQKMNSLNG